MRSAFGFASALLVTAVLLPAPVRAQGAIIESLDELLNRPDAPAFRGTLPARTDLTATLPPPGNQGPTGSCTSWAVTYAAASQAARRAGLGASIKLSPGFTYNKVSGDHRCVAGTTPSSTLDLLRDVGALPVEEFTFDGGWCGRLPTDSELQRAAKYRIKGWSKLDATHLEEVKAQLARGVPVVFAIHASKEFHDLKGDSVFDPPGVLNGEGHAMIAVGYDDARKAFRIQNSWGRGFGDGGYAWVSYEFWVRNARVGYVID